MKNRIFNILSLLVAAITILSMGIPSVNVASASIMPENASPVIIRVPTDAGTLQQALAAVPDGGIIEMAAGTYTSPGGGLNGGWDLNNINKGFTVRAAAGANVTLSGGNANIIMNFQNTNPAAVKQITFERITFANGLSRTNGLSGGITIYKGRAAFVDCKFVNNSLSNSVQTPGGAMYVADNSTVFYINTEWSGNNGAAGGGALGIRDGSKVYIHNSQFLSNGNGNLYNSVGGAINLGNATLRVSNSRFDNNRAGLYGGALYVIGNFTPTDRHIPHADVIVANSVFSNNAAVKDGSSSSVMPTEGGAVNIEDQSLVRFFSTRFINNSANIAGAVNNFRASVEVYGSVFLGNKVDYQDGTAGFGGAISLNSNDGPSDSGDNKQNASLVLQNSWLQGRYGSTTTSAISGGCLFSNGDGPRIENGDDIPNNGTVAQNRARVTATNNVFFDCDTHPRAGKGSMGAIYSVMTELNMENNIIASSTATSDGWGGGIGILYNSYARINNTTFVGNSATGFGGAGFFQGSDVSITNSKIFENSSGNLGSAFFTSVDDARKINMMGAIENNTISNNGGNPVIFDDDRNTSGSPYNGLIYNGNVFFKGSSTTEYRDSVEGLGNPSVLNALVVHRPNIGVNTDKSPQGNNSSASNAPVLGSILAAPSYSLSNRAAGETSNPAAFVLYGFSGGSGRFNGSSVSGPVGTSTATSGTQTLTVGSTNFNASVTARPNPSASFTITPGAFPNYTLNWSVNSGSFLDAAISNNVNNSHTSSGSVVVSAPVSSTYYLYVITQEGGIVLAVNPENAPNPNLTEKTFLPSVRR